MKDKPESWGKFGVFSLPYEYIKQRHIISR